MKCDIPYSVQQALIKLVAALMRTELTVKGPFKKLIRPKGEGRGGCQKQQSIPKLKIFQIKERTGGLGEGGSKVDIFE